MLTLTTLFGILVLISSIFFIVSAILMVTWNYAVPRIIESADPTYKRKTDFDGINYPTSMVFLLLLGILFGSGGAASGGGTLFVGSGGMDNFDPPLEDLGKKASHSYDFSSNYTEV